MPPLPARKAAFAPGHVTGLFEIHDVSSEVARRGSRGAGVCLALGARSVVEVEEAPSFAIDVAIDRAADPAPVTVAAVTDVVKAAVRDGKVALDRAQPKGRRARLRVRVETQLDLPVGQGFGMSAAGALASALATARALGVGRSVAVEAAHAAEVTNRTGLGDVAGAITGGFEIRYAPGVPPWGDVRRFLGYGEIVLAVVGPPISTAEVLSDPARREAVNRAGGRRLDALGKAPSLEAFFSESRAFAEEAGLVTPAVRKALDAASRVPDTLAAMSMLGSSVFAVGPSDAVETALRPFGETWRSAVDPDGARLLAIEGATDRS